MAFTDRNAIFGMGAAALPLAGNGSRGSGRGGDGFVRRAFSRCVLAVAALVLMLLGSARYLLLTLSSIPVWQTREVVPARRGSLVHSEGQGTRRVARIHQSSPSPPSHLRSTLFRGWPRRGFWAWRFSAFVPRVDFAARARTPQTVILW